MIAIETNINPVDLPASKLHLISARNKIPLFYLLRQRPHRCSDEPFNPCDHIFISRGTKKNGIAIINDTFFHTCIDHLITKRFRYFLPSQLLCICLFRKHFQRFMCNISKIKRLKSIFFPIRKPQSITEKMGIRTRRKLLQSCHADTISGSIKFLCHFRRQPGIGSAQKTCV